jgi:hypothetical protein
MQLDNDNMLARRGIVLGTGVLGAALGYAIGRANTEHDNKFNDIASTTLGAFTGLAIGAVVGIKLYPPVVAVKEERGQRTTYLSLLMEF